MALSPTREKFMMPLPTVAWTLRVDNATAQAHTFALQSKGVCYVSAHTKLAAWSKHVQLSSQELAEAFKEAIYPVMRKRHGDGVELHVERAHQFIKSESFDDALVLARIRERNFAPNKVPHVSMAETNPTQAHISADAQTR